MGSRGSAGNYAYAHYASELFIMRERLAVTRPTASTSVDVRNLHDN